MHRLKLSAGPFCVILLSPGLLSGCSTDTPEPPEQGQSVQAGATADDLPPQPAPPSPPAPAKARAIEEKTDGLSFKFSYPAAAARQPTLKDRLEQDIGAARTEWLRFASEHAADRKELGQENPGLAYEGTYEVVADLPRYLSLSFGRYTYGGGAHPNMGTSAILWDKQEDREVTLQDMFGDGLDDAVRNPFCRKLNAEREERRGQPVGNNLDDRFNACPDTGDLTVLIGSSNGKTFDRITLIADPYVAGPWAEGSFAIDLPVTPAVISVVAPAFRPAFGVQ